MTADVARTFFGLACLTLAACGGGGGGGNNQGNRDDSRWALETVNATAAWQNARVTDSNPPGLGARVGILDTGIDPYHPAFESVSMIYEFETSNGISHGTAVAGIIAGSPYDDEWIELGGIPGLAWGAELEIFAITLDDGDTDYTPFDLKNAPPELDDETRSYLRLGEVFATNLDMLNLSLGVNGGIDRYTEEAIRKHFPRTIRDLAQTKKGENPTILVWGAGNAGGEGEPIDVASPELLAGLPVHIHELREHHVAVVSIDRDGRISDFSNRCGSAANWCIAAPGGQIRVAYSDPDEIGWATLDGTSLAAPHVTGTLAIMKQVFRSQLSNKQLVARMYATANKNGHYANRTIYGQGLLDAGKATSPVGRTSAAVGAHVDGPSPDLQTTSLDAGPATGDALLRAFTGRQVAGFDSLGAPFWYRLDTFAGTAKSYRFAAQVRDFAGAGAGPAAERLGHLGLASGATGPVRIRERGLGLRAFAGVPGQSHTDGMEISWSTPHGNTSARAGWLHERDGFLGARTRGGFGALDSGSLFAGGGISGSIGGWKLSADGEVGLSRPQVSGGWIEDISPVLAGAFSLRGERRLGPERRLELTVIQPLRVESGRARFTVPVGRDHKGNVLRERFTAGLRPSGREISVGAAVGLAISATGELRIGAAWTHEPGHIRGARDDIAVMTGIRTLW